jgi:hypothetical protein
VDEVGWGRSHGEFCFVRVQDGIIWVEAFLVENSRVVGHVGDQSGERQEGGFSADAMVEKSDIGVHELMSELQVAPWFGGDLVSSLPKDGCMYRSLRPTQYSRKSTYNRPWHINMVEAEVH